MSGVDSSAPRGDASSLRAHSDLLLSHEQLLRQLHDHALEHLTTEAVARRVLQLALGTPPEKLWRRRGTRSVGGSRHAPSANTTAVLLLAPPHADAQSLTLHHGFAFSIGWIRVVHSW